MTARVPKRILRKLEEARRYASLESASFGFDHDRVSLNGGPPANKTDFIKREVLIHHRSWVLPALDEVIAWAKGGGDDKEG